jgi:hypothetical protein
MYKQERDIIMHRILIAIIISLMLFVTAAIAAELEVIETDVQLQQAILHNPDTGEQRVYQIDEEIDGWRIEEIKADSLTISHPPLNEGGPVVMKTIPVKGSQNIMEEIRRPGE